MCQFYFRDVRISEIKLQLNKAACGRLKRNRTLKQFETVLAYTLFYFRRPQSWNWNKTKMSTLGWNVTADCRQFCFISVLFQIYFMVCDRATGLSSEENVTRMRGTWSLATMVSEPRCITGRYQPCWEILTLYVSYRIQPTAAQSCPCWPRDGWQTSSGRCLRCIA